MRRDIRDFIEGELRSYQTTKKEYEELKQDLILASSGQDDENERVTTSGTSNPTEKKTFKLLSNKRLKRMEETIRAIDRVIAVLDDEGKKFVRLKYWERIYTMDGMANEMRCDRRTLYRWRDKVCQEIAQELGVIE